MHTLKIRQYLLLTAILTCTIVRAQPPEGTQIAFLADVHLQDLYGQLRDNPYRGIPNPQTGDYTLLRTMASQMHSTRIFNENYFAFLAALEDIAQRGIRIVALPGDYTDDGQPLHLRGLQHILNDYSQKYGIRFFITTGNHDPVGPFAQEAGKTDFLGENGQPQALFSKEGLYQTKDGEHPVVITKDLAKMGYPEITEMLKDFGFYPQKKDLYWATPFSNYTPQSYTYKKASQQAVSDNRTYEVAPGFTVPDASYLVEPVAGLWLLAIDGNVYLPKNEQSDASNPKNYQGAGIGYNQVLTNKKHLINWVTQVAEQAEKHHKTLIAFSHYPMVDFNDDASPDIARLLGPDKWQLERVPEEDVARIFADAGIRIHFAGHMHINDTGIRTSPNGHTLVNVQTPSLAAYIPAYKLLTISPAEEVEIETIPINEVPRFDELFALYRTEYNQLKTNNAPDIWNLDILNARSYREFTEMHLQELVRLRFLPDDWPDSFKTLMDTLTAEDLLVSEAAETLQEIATANGFTTADLALSGMDMLLDFYRLRSADQLAISDIGEHRVKLYELAIAAFLQDYPDRLPDDEPNRELVLFLRIFNQFLHGAPADHFTVNLQTGAVHAIAP